MPRPSCGLSAGVKRFNVGRTFERKHPTQKCDSHTKKSQSTTIVNDLVVAGNLLYLRNRFLPYGFTGFCAVQLPFRRPATNTRQQLLTVRS